MRRRKRNLATTVASMDAKVEQPSKKNRNKKRKKNRTSLLPPPLSLSSLPDELLLNCLARMSRYHYRSLSLVSKSFRSLICSQDLSQYRSWIGNTEPYLYLCQNLPPYDRWFFVDQTLNNDDYIRDESSLLPIKPCSSPPISKATTVTVGFEIYQIGGTINNRPSSAVHVFDCRTHKWRDAPNMTVARKRAKSVFIDGKIYVIGGTDESSSWAEVFDTKTQTWKLFSSPFVDAKVVIRRGELYVKSELKEYEYDSKEETWKELPEVFLEPKTMYGRNFQMCFIENVKFSVWERNVIWYDSNRGKWFKVEGLEDMDKQWTRIPYGRLRLANYNGKLLFLWDSVPPVPYRKRQIDPWENNIIWLCMVIKLEKRINLSGLEIWGKIDPVLLVHNSYKFLSCNTF